MKDFLLTILGGLWLPWRSLAIPAFDKSKFQELIDINKLMMKGWMDSKTAYNITLPQFITEINKVRDALAMPSRKIDKEWNKYKALSKS